VKKRLIVVTAALAVLCWAGAATAADMSGSFCRNVNGAVGDIITLTPKGAVSIAELKEGWDKPVYSAGVGSAAGNTFAATLKSKTSPTVIVHAVMKISGNSLSYDSYNMDGSFRWKGDYSRCSR
jgi:hypothetical protein